ncbi:CcoQ/FixQ family Cbb3-type cytochrome c oxidase assembly chaperone [Rhodoflexus caldus]|uniref:CcoQ/FixQ family Cbb3-type cytochrome c oxidase assembly chaperone n=1 Tax=Rhodoflexus caldus TaxID=2891236 RepID=UPI00202A6AB7|nr:CcoQ/FixQ family Cbb3-type cytochrome c oxidase assembly chaperone [Rhodoflexus caldus]
MIRNVLESIDGVDIYPIISLTIFFTLFTAALVYAFRANKESMQALSELPLKDSDEDN